VPAGWYPNLTPTAPRYAFGQTCDVVAPSKVAAALNLVGDYMVIPYDTIRTMAGGPWIGLTTGPGANKILASLVRQAGSDATVDVDKSGVHFSKPVPGLTVRLIGTPTSTVGLRIRVKYTLATDNGYYTTGSTSEVLLIQDSAGVTVLFAEFNSTELVRAPSSGITMDDVSNALDTIAVSYQPSELEPPDAPGPTAGICGTFTGAFAALSLNADTPSPRCGVASKSQQVRITNNRADNVVVRIGKYEAEVKPGETKTIGPAVGEYLAPGHHTVGTVPPGQGPELMVAP
jgi:hypothetical protein